MIYEDSTLIKKINFGIIDYLDDWHSENDMLHTVTHSIMAPGNSGGISIVYIYTIYKIKEDSVFIKYEKSLITTHIYDKNKLERLTIDDNILFLKNYDEVIDKIELYPFDKEKIDKWFQAINKR